MAQTPPPDSADGVSRSMLAVALSVLNLLAAATLLAWVLSSRSPAVAPGGLSTPTPILAGASVTPTIVAIVPPQATNTSRPAMPTATAVSPQLPTATSRPVLPVDTPMPATDTPALPTFTAEALPFTGTPPAPPSPAQPLPPATNTPLAVEAATATSVPAVVGSPQVVHEVQYVVRPGDTLAGLAARFHTTVGAIMRRNGLRTTVIQVGQYLIIPDP